RAPPSPLFPYTTLFRSEVDRLDPACADSACLRGDPVHLAPDAKSGRRGEERERGNDRAEDETDSAKSSEVSGGRAKKEDRPDERSEEHTSELQSPCNLV